MARIIETFCITGYQMKDMDILFPLVPYDQILLKWLGHSEPEKLRVFCAFQDSFLWQKFSIKPFVLKSHHSKMMLLRDLKPQPVDHQYPEFSSCERSILIPQSTLESNSIIVEFISRQFAVDR